MGRTGVLHTATVGSFWGEVAIAWTDQGVSALGWAAQRGEMLGEAVRKSGASQVVTVPPHGFTAAVRDRFPGLVEALARGDSFMGPYDIPWSTSFFDAVWQACRSIPRGEVRTYGWLAEQVGRPRAVRAAGQAMARNPVPLLTPCHRVLSSTLRVGHYGMGGPATKDQLLRLEGYLGDEARNAL